MGVPGSDGVALTAALPQQIQFAISEHQVDEERDRGVWFRELAELTAGDEVAVGELSDPAVDRSRPCGLIRHHQCGTERISRPPADYQCDGGQDLLAILVATWRKLLVDNGE